MQEMNPAPALFSSIPFFYNFREHIHIIQHVANTR